MDGFVDEREDEAKKLRKFRIRLGTPLRMTEATTKLVDSDWMSLCTMEVVRQMPEVLRDVRLIKIRLLAEKARVRNGFPKACTDRLDNLLEALESLDPSACGVQEVEWEIEGENPGGFSAPF